MKLRDDQQRRDNIEAVLIDQYGNQLRPDLVADLLDRFGQVEAVVVEGAVCRHILDTRTDGSGGPIGRWPPKAADIAYQIEQEDAERRRQRQEAEQRRRAKESDAHYVKATRCTEWRAECARAGQIRRMLEHKLDLDHRRPEHMQLIMQTLKACSGEMGLRDIDNDEALHIAEQIAHADHALGAAA